MSRLSLNENRETSLEYLEFCPLCSVPKNFFKPYSEKNNYSVVECTACGLIFVNPRDGAGSLIQQYLNDQTSRVSYYQATEKVDRICFNQRLSRIEQKVVPGKLLDLGCNVGTFMETARERGWNVLGIEPNKKAAEVCRGKNLPVIEELFTEDLVESLRKENFNLVCMNDSLEHFPSPLSVLSLVCRLLPSYGFLSITTPNIESLLARFFQVKPKEHLFYFNRRSLIRLLESAGFSPVFLIETGRKRDIGSLHRGASLGQFWLAVSKFLSVTALDVPISFLLEKNFKDELFALARKN